MPTPQGTGANPSPNGLRTPQITKITNFLVLLFDHDNDLVLRKTYTALSTHSTLRGGLLDGLLRLDIYFLHSYMSDPSERASVALRITILQEHAFDCLRFCAIFCERYFSNQFNQFGFGQLCFQNALPM